MPDDLAWLAEWVRKTAGERELEPRPERRAHGPFVLPPATGTCITTLTWRERAAKQLRTMFAFWRKK